MKNFFTFMFVLLLGFTSCAQEQTINVADYGIKPGKDVTLKVYQLINSLDGKKNITLFFPKGQYEFYPENAFEAYRAVTNHDNSLKKIAFPIYNFDNFTLDGNGSTFMFHGKIVPITVSVIAKISASRTVKASVGRGRFCVRGINLSISFSMI